MSRAFARRVRAGMRSGERGGAAAVHAQRRHPRASAIPRRADRSRADHRSHALVRRTMTDLGVIDRFLNVFSQYIDSGFGLLGPEVTFLSATLIVIDITLAGLFWAMGGADDVLFRL